VDEQAAASAQRQREEALRRPGFAVYPDRRRPAHQRDEPVAGWVQAAATWPRALVDNNGDLWRRFGERWSIPSPGPGLSRAEVDRSWGPTYEVVLVEPAALDDLLAEYAKTCSNFEELAEGALERDRKLRRERDAASRAAVRLAATVDQQSLELRLARAGRLAWPVVALLVLLGVVGWVYLVVAVIRGW
jgi:hypothetical protein